MTRKRWFLPETPDVLGMLRRQMAVTIDGADAFARWVGGDAAAAQAVRDAEHRGDLAKRAKHVVFVPGFNLVGEDGRARLRVD